MNEFILKSLNDYLVELLDVQNKYIQLPPGAVKSMDGSRFQELVGEYIELKEKAEFLQNQLKNTHTLDGAQLAAAFSNISQFIILRGDQDKMRSQMTRILNYQSESYLIKLLSRALFQCNSEKVLEIASFSTEILLSSRQAV